VIEKTNPRTPRHQFQPLRYSLMRVVVFVASMPGLITGLVRPVCDQPDLIGIIKGADHLELDESWFVVHEPGTITKSLPDLFSHMIGDREMAQYNKHMHSLSGFGVNYELCRTNQCGA
jgi:hypothetical protein